MKITFSTLGFTFVEILVVIAILIILAGLAIPFYQSFQLSSQLDNTAQEVVQSLRRAQSQAMASDYFSEYGIFFGAHDYTIFRGASFDPADTFNEVFNVSSTLTINLALGGSSSVVFSRVQGVPNNTGSITLISANGEERLITIQNPGIVYAQ